MTREALVPIDEEVQALITEQRVRVNPAPWLFPRPTKTPDGPAPVSFSTYRLALFGWPEKDPTCVFWGGERTFRPTTARNFQPALTDLRSHQPKATSPPTGGTRSPGGRVFG
jgi:hypothetical protein